MKTDMKSETFGKVTEGFEMTESELRARASEVGADYIVRFENHNYSSRRGGEATLMFVGHGCTYKTLEEVEGQHLGQVPSMFMYPVSYVKL